MHTKLKAAGALVALAVGGLLGGHANAAPISDDGMGVGGAGLLTGTGDGDFFITVEDTVRNQGFILNLGQNVLSTATSPASFSLTSTELASWIAGGTQSNMRWNFFGLSNTDSDVAAPFPDLGFVTSHATSQSSFGADGFSALTFGLANVGNYLTAVNGAAGIAGGLASNNYVIVGSSSSAYPNANEFNGSGGGYLSFDNRLSGFASSMFVSYVYSPGDFSVDPNIPEAFRQLGTVAINALTGQVSFNAPTAVPLPAAVWLLGSGLLGLAGISRRRMSSAAAAA